MAAETRGMKVDLDFIDWAVDKHGRNETELERILWDSCGTEFNWRSPQQLSRAIYDGLGISKPKNPFADADGIDRSRFADSGLYKSTCTSTFLLVEKTHHPLGTLIGALRETQKLRRTLEKYRELAGPDGYVHQSYNQTGTRTGRLSCSRPNMQNVPSQVRGRFTQSVYSGSTLRTEEYNLRNTFIAEPGYEFLSIDYKQMEMRMFGLLAKDPYMLAALAAGADIHAEIAKKVWGIVDKTHREWSKTIGFGLIYGMTLGSLMHKLNQTHAQAAVIRDQYLREFPRIMPWMNEVIEACMAHGYVRYWSGRIWREDVQRDMYKGANALIQGGCADILSIAALRSDEWCQANPAYDTHIVNFVHDELKFHTPVGTKYEVAAGLAPCMEVPDIFNLPFMTDSKSGPSYGSQEGLFEKPAYKQEVSVEPNIEKASEAEEEAEQLAEEFPGDPLWVKTADGGVFLG